MDEENITPSDYALYVRGIPVDVSEDEIKTSFESQWESDKIEVHSVDRIYDCGEIISKERKLMDLKIREALLTLKRADLLQEADHLTQKDPIVYERYWIFWSRPIDLRILQREINSL